MMHDQILEIIRTLRVEKSDNRQYEAKAAVAGFPQTALRSISAFANTPGGGILIFGVDENQGFTVTGVYDSRNCQQTLANYANKEFSSPISIITDLVAVEGKPVVIGKVLEADKFAKPIKVRKTGKAYIRLFDSDFELSELEEQRFITERGVSKFDEAPVPGSGLKDLNAKLLEAYISNRGRASTVIADMAREEILVRTGIVTESGELTTAGLLALGIYPQQYLPNYSIQASVRKSAKYSAAVRAINAKTFDGPIPVMLKNVVKWVDENSDDLIMDIEDWKVGEVKEYPLRAVRELVANALIHRDLNPASMTQNISLAIEDGRLSISNPGGLYGISLGELGQTASSTRNARLAEICQYIPADDDAKVVERLGTGIPKIYSELEKYGLPDPLFFDGGIYFTAILRHAEPEPWPKPAKMRNNRDIVISAISEAHLTKTEIARKTGLTSSQVRYALQKLIEEKRAVKAAKNGDPGTKYAAISPD
ncbi:MAG: putative DNA binding domain-containing protein [Clostridiales Family XIII bacterium]|jgi:ATP-dependent DNA helicase RecG|nr:putative DNA binding domain-containing protein [Clostridiales Family XIII bacterium]